MLKLNFHHLYYFYVIAEELQVARAARRLSIGQPTLSTQLKQFEEFLAYRLFDRKRGQTISLTDRGEILHHYAKEIFRLSDEMLEAAKGLRSDKTLHLRIGALDWLPKREVSELLSLALERFDCFVSVHEDTSGMLLKKLSDHQFDLIVTNTPAPYSEDQRFRAHRIALLPVMICGAPRFRALKAGFPYSLQGQPIILPSQHGRTRHIIDDYLRVHGLRPRLVGEAQDGELLRRAAISGHALVPLSPSTIEGEIERGDLITLGTLLGVHEEIWLISAERLIDHPVVTYLMTEFRTSPEILEIIPRRRTARTAGPA